MLNEKERNEIVKLGEMLDKIINWKPNEKEKDFPEMVSKISIDCLTMFGRKRTALLGVALLIVSTDLMSTKDNAEIVKTLTKYIQ